MKRDVLAGALFVNAVPHTVMGLAGKRCLTPLGGEDSSSGTNLLWAGINIAGGTALLVSSGWCSIDQRTAAKRLAWIGAGSFAMNSFGMIYELTAGRRKRAGQT